MVAAVAAGAFAAAAAGQTLQATSGDSNADVTPLASSHDASAAFGIGGNAPVAAPSVLPVARTSDGTAEAQKLADSAQVTEARHEREAQEAEDARIAAEKAAEEAARPDVVAPAEGRKSSGYGARWGVQHRGVDIANSLGTPIVAAMDGTVLEAGPASGFGLWVRIQHDDGTITVYGHMNSFSVSKGERVKAGDQIAEIGSRGQSTGPHLHFEVWLNGGKKIDPVPWLAERGVHL